MSSIKVLAGDFKKGEGQFVGSAFMLKTVEHSFVGERVPCCDVEALDIATEESVKHAGGTLGWGAAGAVLLGPAGLLAGLLLGGRGKEVTFVVRFDDGRKLLASCDAKTYGKIQAACFRFTR